MRVVPLRAKMAVLEAQLPESSSSFFNENRLTICSFIFKLNFFKVRLGPLKKAQWVKVLNAKVIIWVQSQEPTRRKEKTNSFKLSSDLLHIRTVMHQCTRVCARTLNFKCT